MPRCAMRNAGSRVTSAPAIDTLPARARTSPMMVRISVVLPMPLRPIRPSASPRRERERDAAQDVALVVVGVQIARFDQRGGVMPWPPR